MRVLKIVVLHDAFDNFAADGAFYSKSNCPMCRMRRRNIFAHQSCVSDPDISVVKYCRECFSIFCDCAWRHLNSLCHHRPSVEHAPIVNDLMRAVNAYLRRDLAQRLVQGTC